MKVAVKSDPRIMHGTPCFSGTRVPVQTFFDWLEEGQTLDYFLEQFPTVKRKQVMAAKQLALKDAR
jgi:uncharacterized protein (DUF433 family)